MDNFRIRTLNEIIAANATPITANTTDIIGVLWIPLYSPTSPAMTFKWINSDGTDFNSSTTIYDSTTNPKFYVNLSTGDVSVDTSSIKILYNYRQHTAYDSFSGFVPSGVTTDKQILLNKLPEYTYSISMNNSGYLSSSSKTEVPMFTNIDEEPIYVGIEVGTYYFSPKLWLSSSDYPYLKLKTYLEWTHPIYYTPLETTNN